jgi:hypothetical protein
MKGRSILQSINSLSAFMKKACGMTARGRPPSAAWAAAGESRGLHGHPGRARCPSAERLPGSAPGLRSARSFSAGGGCRVCGRIVRLALAAAREALVDAGLDTGALRRKRVGVLMGTNVSGGVSNRELQQQGPGQVVALPRRSASWRSTRRGGSPGISAFPGRARPSSTRVPPAVTPSAWPGRGSARAAATRSSPAARMPFMK